MRDADVTGVQTCALPISCRGRPRQAGGDRRGPGRPAPHGGRALMRPLFDTLRARILAGLIPLLIGLVGTALLRSVTLRQVRQAIAARLGELRASSEVCSGPAAPLPDQIPLAQRRL